MKQLIYVRFTSINILMVVQTTFLERTHDQQFHEVQSFKKEEEKVKDDILEKKKRKKNICQY